MKLTKRLQQAVDLIQNPDGLIADVGTDHGLVPIYLARKFPGRKIYGLDVRPGPLEKAKNNARDYKLSDRIEFYLSDGLKSCLNQKISTIIITGMGGILMARILKEGQLCLSEETELILSPQSDPDLVRRILHDLEFGILKERYVKENNKIYLLIYARKGRQTVYKEANYYFGNWQITEPKELLKEVWQMELRERQMILEQLSSAVKSQEQEEKKELINLQIGYLKELLQKAKE